MLKHGYITQEEYDEALADDVYARVEGLDIATGSSSTYSYFVDTLIEQLIDDLMTQKGYTETQATNLIYKGGLQVYSTQDTSMQEIADEAINNPSFYPSSTEFSINYALSVKNADGKIINYSHSTMQTWYQNVQGNYNFSLTQTNEDTAQQYVDTYREAMTANGENGCCRIAALCNPAAAFIFFNGSAYRLCKGTCRRTRRKNQATVL